MDVDGPPGEDPISKPGLRGPRAGNHFGLDPGADPQKITCKFMKIWDASCWRSTLGSMMIYAYLIVLLMH